MKNLVPCQTISHRHACNHVRCHSGKACPCADRCLRRRYALFLMSFTATLREGIEALIFITGVSRGNPEGVALPGVVGILLGCIFSYIVFFGSKPVDIRYFMCAPPPLHTPPRSITTQAHPSDPWQRRVAPIAQCRPAVHPTAARLSVRRAAECAAACHPPGSPNALRSLQCWTHSVGLPGHSAGPGQPPTAGAPASQVRDGLHHVRDGCWPALARPARVPDRRPDGLLWGRLQRGGEQ